ncbi:ribonuclease III [Hydrogenothermus marinus]|uniref:Ribonuclease 3 n=1 Tax=Hydrogenothermus marinus TaxID=133270 RepID=A0A3M0BHV5_9AQUI|nr:ribonuclease III [Hydrogenothermus marinus]RMA96176.1 ribonuclease-3 [Hydrogenothermus marinus]
MTYPEKFLKRIEKLEEILGYTFKNKEYPLTALTHSSFVSEYKKDIKDYEVLEFLGDSVLSLIVSEILIKQYPKAREGELSKIRSSVISEAFLAKLAKMIKLNELVLLSRGEIAQKGMERESLLCDVFEAVFGAIYTDCGYYIDPPRQVFNRLFKDFLIKSIENNEIPRDYKSILQVYTQKHLKTIPKYILVEAKGPEHEKEFTVLCKVEDIVETIGKGKSKKEAENKAASKAYKKLKEKN